MYRPFTALVLILSLLAANVFGQELEVEAVAEQPRRGEMFNLYTHCRPISTEIFLNPDAHQLGVDQALVRAAIESRLRAAGLYLSKLSYKHPSLVVRIDVVGSAFSITLTLRRELYNLIQDAAIDDIIRDELPGTSSPLEPFYQYYRIPGGLELPSTGTAITWFDRVLGVSGDAAFIRSRLSEGLDVFLANYLRVNEAAC